MIQPEKKRIRGPVVRHNADNKVLVGKITRIVKEFSKNIDSSINSLVRENRLRKEHLFRDDTVKAETLRALRQKLVTTIKKGMLEREDLEQEIMLLAAMVWFGRQKKEKQDRILEGM